MEKEIAIIGVGTRIEIWNKEKWKKYNSDENISADEIAENMTMLRYITFYKKVYIDIQKIKL